MQAQDEMLRLTGLKYFANFGKAKKVAAYMV
jgi:hypothetical protein